MHPLRLRRHANVADIISRRYSTGEARRPARSRPTAQPALRAPTNQSPISQTVSLARLPKTKAKNFQSLHFRDTTPGSSAKLVTDSFQLHRPTAQKPYPNAEWYTDPTHPIHTCSFKDVPKYESAFFKIRAYPFARLAPHSSSVPNPYTEEMKKGHRKSQMPMSLIVPMTPYSLHKSGAIRKVVRSRLKEALRLVVVRGARGSDPCEASSAILDENDATPEKWVMKDWTYVFKPTMVLYKSPMPTIVDEIRIGLRLVKSMAERLEARGQLRVARLNRDVTGTGALHHKP